MDLFVQFVSNGLVTGVFYALSAVGLTLIFGLMRVVNFAHGEFYMLGGMLGALLTSGLGLDFYISLLLMAVAMAAFGYLVDRVLIERVRGEGEESSILLTIGLSIFLANLTLLIAGPTPQKVMGALTDGPVFLGPVISTKMRLLAVCISVAVIVATHLLIQHTKIGAAMRATFLDPMAARLVGIRTNRIYGVTFALGTVLAATSGMLLGTIYQVQPAMGGIVSLKAFVIVILGGMGSFSGAIVSGLALGVAEALWGGYVATGTVDIIGFIIVILVLLLRPQGLFALSSERV